MNSIVDIGSIWVRRPLLPNQARTQFELNGIYVEYCLQRDGSSKWAIRSGERDCLGKDGEWIMESLPSKRDDAYLRMYRWDIMTEAFKFAQEHTTA